MVKKFIWMLLLPVFFSVGCFKPFRWFKHSTTKTAPADNIVFVENNWDLAIKKASAQKKFIFVDCYATWCGPCKMLKARTFTDKNVADFFNKNFINVSIDIEAGQGPMLAQQWQIRAVPTLIIFDENAKPVLGTMGFIEPNDLMRFAEQALNQKK